MAIIQIDTAEFKTWRMGRYVFIALEKGSKSVSIRMSVEDAKKVARAIADTAK